MTIRLLDRDTIEKITAGEVVERPYSVVKELVENSIDAGATSISVEIREGGSELIKVSDNGCGINAGEVKLALQSHATSKLRSAAELSNVATMGFRGEALPSIAAVSKMTIVTKPRDAQRGIRLVCEGGEIKDIRDEGCPDGTSVTVKDLFYNVPVRRVFLKKQAYEQSLIVELMQKLAMGNPSISFRLSAQGKLLFSTYGDGNIKNAALAVFGADYARNLRPVDESEGTFSLKGVVGIGEESAPTRSRQAFFLNGRLINCRALSQALEETVRGLVTVGRYPSCVLMVNVPYGSVDVNVHPGKLEVRFKDEGAFRLSAQTLLARALSGYKMLSPIREAADTDEPVGKVSFEPAAEARSPRTEAAGLEYLKDLDIYKPDPAKQYEVRESYSVLDMRLPPKPVRVPEEKPEQAAFIDKSPAQGYKLLGVYLSTYILLEVGTQLVLIDQHAAHERLNYERYTKALDEGCASQKLLVPMVIDLSPREIRTLEAGKAELEKAGYEVELFGDTSVKVTSVPFMYGESELKPLFIDMIDSLDMLRRAEADRRLEAIIQASCKHAVKGGERLTNAEIEALIKQLNESASPPTCPHGRPIMKVFTQRQVEQMFKRIQ
ncbi:MAG: DNA mismatch repair endonuclease MutL [Clostridiales bacterium]|nr:DNA mismatch repair endonuclease MutL [Clostridiales bacterium]